MVKMIFYQLYLLQLENYELRRYLKLLFKKGFLPPEKPLRKKLVWTIKARMIFVCSGLVHIILSLAVFYHYTAGLSVFSIKYYVFSLLFFIVCIPFYFLFFILCVILLWPADYLFKSWLKARARARIEKYPQIKIIGVAGSYGKTTIKEVLKAVLSARFKVISTSESVNTPVGISRWILKKITPEVDVAIVEMGEHYSGDIREICEIAPPDIAVITGVNEAHLERMKSMETVESTIFEAVSSAKPGALVILNGDDARIRESYKKYAWPDHKILEYRASNIHAPNFNVNGMYWGFKIDESEEVKLHLLGEYALGDADCAIKIGQSMGMSLVEIKHGMEKVRPVEHRLQPSVSPGNILVIDDAYNGNSAGAAEAIKVLSRFADRRKIYITPGLVETGKAAKEVHVQIGRQLAGVADVVILIRNSVTGYIEEGILSVIARNTSDEAISTSGRLPRPSDALRARNDKPEIIWFETAQEAHLSLSKILKPNDVILFQNDWGDQYV